MKTLVSIIALSLGINAALLHAKECTLSVAGNKYSIQQIVDKVQSDVMFYENQRDMALTSSGIELPKTGRILYSEKIQSAKPKTDSE